MRRVRPFALATASALLVITALGLPATAAPKAHLAIVNGIPGRKVDVCLAGKEVRSALPYGGKAVRKVTGTPKTIKFRARRPGTCTGPVLAKKQLGLAPGSDKTVVATKKAPKVLVWDNGGLGSLAVAGDAALVWRHAADVGEVGFTISLDQITPAPFIHAADEIWEKGDEWGSEFTFGEDQYVSALWVVLPFSEFAYVGPHLTYVVAGRRYQWIFVGTKDPNARVVTLKQSLAP